MLLLINIKESTVKKWTSHINFISVFYSAHRIQTKNMLGTEKMSLSRLQEDRMQKKWIQTNKQKNKTWELQSEWKSILYRKTCQYKINSIIIILVKITDLTLILLELKNCLGISSHSVDIEIFNIGTRHRWNFLPCMKA